MCSMYLGSLVCIHTLAHLMMTDGLYLFVADWASEPCTSAHQILSASASKHAIPFTVINEDADPAGLFDGMGIEVVPSVVALRGGQVVGRVEGVDSKGIISLVERYNNNEYSSTPIVNTGAQTTAIQATVQAPPLSAPTPTAYSTEQLVALVNSHKLMLFIKGTPDRPQCGFTTQLLRLLSDHGLNSQTGHFATFNILEDAPLRAALKDWAQWPTYPQVYWKGELMGGLDILKEMFASGQMDPILEELKQ